MPTGNDWGLAWVKLERALSVKLQEVKGDECVTQEDEVDRHASIQALEWVKSQMERLEPK